MLMIGMTDLRAMEMAGLSNQQLDMQDDNADNSRNHRNQHDLGMVERSLRANASSLGVNRVIDYDALTAGVAGGRSEGSTASSPSKRAPNDGSQQGNKKSKTSGGSHDFGAGSAGGSGITGPISHQGLTQQFPQENERLGFLLVSLVCQVECVIGCDVYWYISLCLSEWVYLICCSQIISPYSCFKPVETIFF